MFSDVQPHPHHAAHLSLGVVITTICLTIAFHFLVADHPYGIAFAIFVILLTVGLHIVAMLSGRTGNAWAYLFLAPVLLSTIAEVLYASDVVRALGFVISLVSLIFFSYWLTAPRTPFREIPTLWSQSLALESVIPARGGEGLLKNLSLGQHGKKVFLGIVIALPFLLIIGTLFGTADPLFGKVVGDLFKFDDLFLNIMKLIRDGIVAVYLGRAGWLMLTRATEQRKTVYGIWAEPSFDRTILLTFLGLLNALFLVFVGFQIVYFFSGEAAIQQQGITYADYARQGFFQLLAVAGIVFVISGFLYRYHRLREWSVRGLSLFLIAQTGVVIISAINRLVLYVETYGLSVARVWAMIVIFTIGLALLLLAIGSLVKATYSTMAKMIFVGTLFLFSAILTVNIEGLVASWNLDRYVQGKTDQLDVLYLIQLSSDAVPVLAQQWKDPKVVHAARLVFDPVCDAKLTKRLNDAGIWDAVKRDAERESCSADHLQDRQTRLQEQAQKDWRNLVLSDYRAMAALGSGK